MYIEQWGKFSLEHLLKKLVTIFIIFILVFSFPVVSIESEKSSKDNSLEPYQYLIITPQIFVSNFELLRLHKAQYLPAHIISLEEILENKSFWVHGRYGDATNADQGNPFIKPGMEVTRNFSLFNDTSAKVRNFIRYTYLKWNVKYVLIGGDHEFIPARRFHGYIEDWAAGKTQRAINAEIISDHYFAALNGTWNTDFDQYFGETKGDSVSDEADFKAEVYVGRAPVNDKSEVNIFVHKVIHYETHEKPKDIQFQQSYTNPQHIPDTSLVSESCASHIPSTFTIHKLYEKDAEVTPEQWAAAFKNPDKLLMFHVGNGYNSGVASWYQLSWDGNQRIKFHILDAGGLNNTFYPIHISISCLIADFSVNECLSEELLLTRNGGPSACIGNSEVGCITRNDARAYSGEYYEQLFIELFKNNESKLGDALYQCKQVFISKAENESKYRWCFYTMNLLGDPETPVFKLRNNLDYHFDSFIVDDDFNEQTDGWQITRFSSIQQAVEQIGEFGSIHVQPGTYHEHISINKTITIKGYDKNTTIICQNNALESEVIRLSCNSTMINNLTITTNNQHSDVLHCLIHICTNSNGNTINNCIIKGNQGYGIYMEDAIRNTIINCIIEQNVCGIIIKNIIEDLLPRTIIITCDNIIQHNIIRSNSECGIFIQGSLHNYIIHNVFHDNGNLADMYGYKHQYDLCLRNTKWNEIDRNYWDGATDNPHMISSLYGPIMIFGPDFSKGFLFKLIQCFLIINIGIPFYPVYDYHPLTEPFNIH